MKKVESMDEYIKGVLSYARQFEYHQQKKTAEFFYDLADYLKSLPTVEAKPVVHCKDCVHWGTGVAGETEHVKCCEYGKYMVGENGYCCYAERGGKNE